MADVFLSTGIDVNEAQESIKRFAQSYAEQLKQLERPVRVKLDESAAREAVKGLAREYKALGDGLSSSINSQKAALAALSLAGKKGSEEYENLANSIRKDITEAKKLEKAASDVEKEFEDPIVLKVDTDKAEKDIGGIKAKIESLKSGVGGALQVAGGNLLGNALSTVTSGLSDAVKEGDKFQTKLADLESITGISGPQLDDLGKRARNLAKEMGGNASDNVEAFKAILSKLGPDIAKNPEALEKMSRSVATLSKATGDDAAASVHALTTGLLQFQVSLDDPAKAADVMVEQMNSMAAGAKEGAAEVPQVADALEKTGVAASNANVGFAETNALLQQLAAGGKLGAEAGTSLNAIMGIMGKGRFLPKDTAAALKEAGVDIDKLGDKTISFSARLRELQKIEKDTALMSQLFGSEHSAAANILVANVDNVDELTKKLTGTNTATEQAAVRMKTFSGLMEVLQANVADVGITIFDAFQPLLTSVVKILSSVLDAAGPILKQIGEAISLLATPLQQIITPIVSTLSKLITPIVGFASTIIGIVSNILTAAQPVLQKILNVFTQVFDKGLGNFLKIVQKPLQQLITAFLPLLDIVGMLVDALAPLFVIWQTAGLQLIAPIIEALLPPIISIVKSIVSLATVLISAVMPVLNLLIPILSQLITIIVTALGDSLGFIIGLVAEFAAILIQGLASAITFIVNGVKSLVEWLVGAYQTIKDFLAPIIDKLIDVFETIGETLYNIVSGAIETVVGWMTDLYEIIQEKVIPIVQDFIEWHEKIARFIDEKLIAAFNKLIEWIKSAYDWVKNLISRFLEWTGISAVFNSAMNVVKDAIASVIKFFGNINAEIAGIGAAFQLLAKILFEFADAVVHLDFSKAADAFDDFFGRIKKAYEDAKNKKIAEDAAKDIEKAFSKPVKVTPKVDPKQVTKEGEKAGESIAEGIKSTTEKKVKDIKIANYDSSADEKTIKLQQESILKALRDLADETLDAEAKFFIEREIIVTKFGFERENVEREHLKELKKLDDKANEDRKNGVKNVEEELTKAKTAQAKLFGQQRASIAEEEFREQSKLGDKRIAELIKQGEEEKDIVLKTTQAEIDATLGFTEDAIIKRGNLQLSLLAQNQDKIARAIIQKIPKFQEEANNISVDLARGIIDQPEAEKQLDLLFLRYRTASLELQSNIITDAEERKNLVDKIDDELSNAQAKAAQSAAERERAARLAEVEKTLREELRMAEENIDLIRAAYEKAALERYRIEQGFQQDTNELFNLGIEAIKAFTNSSLAEKEIEVNARIDLERAGLNAQETELRLSLARNAISDDEFSKRLAEIDQRRAQLAVEQEENKWTIVKQLQEGSASAFGVISEHFQKQTEVNVEKSAAQIAEMAKKGEFSFSALADVGKSALGAIGAEVLRLAVSGKANLGQMAAAAASMLINVAQNALTANIVTIYSTAIGMMGPILGAAAATTAIAGITLLLQLAQAKLAANKPKFHKGRVPSSSVTDREEEVTILSSEAVINPKATRKNIALLDWINKHNEDGEVFFKRRKTIYENRIEKNTMSPIVVVMKKINVEVNSAQIERSMTILLEQNDTLIEIISDIYLQGKTRNKMIKDIKGKIGRAIRTGRETISDDDYTSETLEQILNNSKKRKMYNS